MKLLHLADLHIGKKVNGFSMLEDQKYILSQICDIVATEKTEVVLIAGDVYDKSVPPAEAVEVLDEFLTSLVNLDQKILIISGNHDSEERLAFASRVMKQAGVYMTPVFAGTVEKIVLQDAYGDVHFYMLPFMKPGKATEVITALNENIDKQKRNILVAHQFLTGAVPSESEEFMVGGIENMDAGLFADYDYVALGHIHRAQQISVRKGSGEKCNAQIHYAGTPLKYSFSEVNHKKSVTIVDIKEKGDLCFLLVELHPLRDMREVKGTYMEITARENYQNTNIRDYMHVTLTDEEDIPDVIAKLRVIYPNLMKLDYDNTRTRSRRTITTENTVEKKTPMELFGDFYEQQNNQKMTEEQFSFAKNILEKISL